MCVIIYKPKGALMPSKSLLDKAQRFNPHGCGFCTPTKTYRGLSYAEFTKKLKQVGDEPVLIHFRFATHGSLKKTNCHPFYDKKTDTYFMHNGILPINSENDMTDSEIAFRQILQPTIKDYGLSSPELIEEVDEIIGFSKFAFMQNEEVNIYGDFRLYEGCYFSNLNFLRQLTSLSVFIRK